MGLFGLFGKKHKNNTTTSPQNNGQQNRHQNGQQAPQQRATTQIGSLSFQFGGDGWGTLTAPNGERVYGIISPAPQDISNYSYADEILPGIYRFLATVDSGFKPLTDTDLPQGFSLDQPVLGDATLPARTSLGPTTPSGPWLPARRSGGRSSDLRWWRWHAGVGNASGGHD